MSRDHRLVTLWEVPTKVSYHRAYFGVPSHFGSESIMNLVCQVILQDRVIKVSFDFMCGSPSW